MKERIIALWRMIAFLALVPVMSMILVACKPDEGGTIIPPVTPPAMTTHEAVDLGLSVKWASCNIGAESPEDLGGYYAWGETEEKTEYSWSTYRWYDTDNHKYTEHTDTHILEIIYKIHRFEIHNILLSSWLT